MRGDDVVVTVGGRRRVSDRPVAGRLAVVDEGDRVLVVLEDDPTDWICAFAKAA